MILTLIAHTALLGNSIIRLQFLQNGPGKATSDKAYFEEIGPTDCPERLGLKGRGTGRLCLAPMPRPPHI